MSGASPEKQIDYLMKLLWIKNAEIVDLHHEIDQFKVDMADLHLDFIRNNPSLFLRVWRKICELFCQCRELD